MRPYQPQTRFIEDKFSKYQLNKEATNKLKKTS